MGTRNIRILRSQVAARQNELIGKTAHVVLLDGRTYSGEVVTTSAEELKMRDANARWTSFKRHTHTIGFDQIMEVILDTVTDY